MCGFCFVVVVRFGRKTKDDFDFVLNRLQRHKNKMVLLDAAD
jgi:hypothetical protein